MKRDDPFLDTAHRIARHIAAAALWDGDRCTWEIQELVPETGRGRREAAAGGLYQGTAGIALFLAEAYRACGDGELARAALGGLAHSLAWAEEQPVSYSLHGGRLGSAWVAARLAAHFDRDDLRARGERLLAPLAGREGSESGIDVIAGAAGAIPVLLQLAADLGRSDWREMATRLGERLLDTACRQPGGWSWSTVGPSAGRHLCGYAHGASGVALALLELAAATGDGRFRFAAEMGFLYERRAFSAEHSNWPDLRHRELSRVYHAGGGAAVRAADAAGEIPPFEPAYMSAWCHGAPGVGLARVRAFELTGEPTYRREAEAALVATRRTLGVPPSGNFCLCHGTAGNAELALEAARVFAEPALAEPARRCALWGRETYGLTGRPWPCGSVDAADDPSLMVGEAGMGYFFLRLARPDTPSVLLPRPGVAPRRDEDDGYAALAAAWVEECFVASRAVFADAGEGWPPGGATFDGGETFDGDGEERFLSSPVERVYAALEAAAPHPGDGRADAFRLDAARYALDAGPVAVSARFLAGLRRPAAQTIDWATAVVRPAPGVRRVTTERDWTAADAATEGAAEWLLHRDGVRTEARRLSPWVALVVDAVVPAADLATAAERVASRLEGASSEAVAAQVQEQIRELYRAGLIDLAPDERRWAAAG